VHLILKGTDYYKAMMNHMKNMTVHVVIVITIN